MVHTNGGYHLVAHAEPATADPDREIVDAWAETRVSPADTPGKRPDGRHGVLDRRGQL